MPAYVPGCRYFASDTMPSSKGTFAFPLANTDEMARVSTIPNGTPRSAPVPTSTDPRFRTSERMRDLPDPKAIRIPMARVCCATE